LIREIRSHESRLITRWKVSTPFRIAIYLAEYVLGIALVSLLILESGWFQRVLERRVVSGIQEITGGRVELGYFRFRPWLLQITLQDLVIHGGEKSNDAPLCSVRLVVVGVNPAQLLRSRLRLRYADLDGLDIHLRSDARGVTNLPEPRQKTSVQEGLSGFMDLSIGRLTIAHAAAYWNDRKEPVGMDARDLAVLLHKSEGHYSGSISSASTIIRSPDWALPPIRFSSRFELSSQSFSFPSFAWKTRGMSGDAIVTILPIQQIQVAGTFRANLDLIALAPILHAPEWKGGTVHFEGTGRYLDGVFSSEGKASGRKVSIVLPNLAPMLIDAASNYKLENDQLSLTNLFASVWGGSTQGSMTINFQGDEPKFALDTRLHQIRLDNLLLTPGTPPVFARQMHPVSMADGSYHATWTGRGDQFKATYDLVMKVPPNIAPDMLPVSGAARGSMAADDSGFTLRLADSQFHTPHSDILAHGTLTPIDLSPAEPLAINLTTDSFQEWKPFFQSMMSSSASIPLELKSKANVMGELGGTYTAPTFSGNLAFGAFRYQGLDWDRMSAAVILNPKLIEVTGGRLAHQKSYFDVDGSAQLVNWGMAPNSQIHFSARALHTPIEGLTAASGVHVPLSGLMSGNLDVNGTPDALEGSGSVQVENGTLADEPFDALSSQLRVVHSVWELQHLRLRKGAGQMTGELSIEPARRHVSGEIQGNNFRLEDVHGFPTVGASEGSKGKLSGGLNFSAHGEGMPGNLHLQGSWRVQNFSVAGTALGEIDGTISGEGDQLTFTSENRSEAGAWRLNAHATAGDGWPVEADGQYSSLRGDPWIRAFFNRQFAAGVLLEGSVHARGSLRDPDRMDVQARIDNVAVNFPSIQWKNAQPVNVHYVEGRLGFSPFTMRGPSTELQIAGTVGLKNGVALGLTAEGTANAALLSVFDAKVLASGRSVLRFRLTGTPDRPLMNGAMEIQDVNLAYSDLPFHFNNLQGTINLEGERAVISSLRGSSGGGAVNINGFVTLVEHPRYQVRADLNQVRVRYPESFTSVFDGNLRLDGDFERAQLQGDIVVRQMVLNQNVNFISKIMDSSNTLAGSAPVITSPLASMVRLNVRVTSSPPVQLQSPNFRLMGDIDLRLQGTLANPIQIGSIHFLSGETVFRGNRYTLMRGDMNMTNPFRTQTYLDMEVETTVQSYDLTLDISGPLDRLKFSYRSDPPLANTDILSLLALGYVRQEQAFGAVAGNPSASVGASAILSEALSTQTTSRIQHLFGVSRIKIDPNVAVPGFGSGARVTVEQQVSHDLTLTYVTDTSYSQYRIIQFEWNINPNVSVLGVRDQNGVFGIEFRFRRRFK
jgi:translocation and assembly module TamB